MDPNQRMNNGQGLADQSTSSANAAVTSSGSSQTSGHGTDGSLNSAAPAAASDPLATLLLLLQQQQQTAATAVPQQPQPPLLPPPLDPTTMFAARANSNALFSSLAMMTNQMEQQHLQQQEQQRQQDVAAAAAAVAASLPAPQYFPPILGNFGGLGLSGASMPPPPSAFPVASAFDPANTAALIAAITQQAASMQQQQQQQQQPQSQLRFDPALMSALLGTSSSTASSSSAFAPPLRNPPMTSAFTVPQSSQQQPMSFTSAFTPTSSVPPAFAFASNPSSMQKISDPKPSITVPPLRPKKAVAVRRGGNNPLAPAGAAPSFEDMSSGASTSSSGKISSGLVASADTGSPDRSVRPEGSRKRTTPSPHDENKKKDEKKWIHVDNDFFDQLMTSPIDYEAMKTRLKSGAAKSVKDVKRPVMEDDDDCQIIGEVINRRYRDHTENVIYNVTYNEHMADIRDRHYVMSRHQATVLRLRYIAEHVIRSLNEFGWAVVDHFLGDDHVTLCAKEMVKLYEKGLFTAGQLMDNEDDEFAPHHHRTEDDIKSVRSDYIYWYDGVDKRATEAVTTRLLVSMLDAMISHFGNRIDGKHIAGRSRAMLAIYPGDETRYVKHVDNPNEDGRLITCIYYCNANWNLKEHGGALRLFPETSECAMDIDPQADRLVFFWSDRRNPHEVMPVLRHRFAITIWYMDHKERTAEQERKARRRAMQQKTADESTTSTTIALQPQAAAFGQAASQRPSDINIARRFEMARSECTQDDVGSGDDEMSDFIPPSKEAQPDYEI